DVPQRLHRRGVDCPAGGAGMGLLWPGTEAVADRMELAAGDDGDLPGLRPVADPLGASHAGLATESTAGLAAAGLLPEYPGGLWRLRRGPGPLGGLAGQRDPGDHAAGDLFRGGPGGQLVAG